MILIHACIASYAGDLDAADKITLTRNSMLWAQNSKH